jgi:AraC-like DNA-binding protein
MVGSSVISELDLLQNTIALEQQQSAESRSLLLLSYLAQLLGIVLNNMIQPDKQSKGCGGDIENAALFMRNNYNKKVIKLPELAKMSYMSVSGFTKRFLQEFGLPPMRYLLKLRLHHAQKLLMHSEYSITDVALACGFRDPLYFTRQFRRQIGCTPSEYRLHGQGRIQITSGEHQRNDYSFLNGE